MLVMLKFKVKIYLKKSVGICLFLVIKKSDCLFLLIWDYNICWDFFYYWCLMIGRFKGRIKVLDYLKLFIFWVIN